MHMCLQVSTVLGERTVKGEVSFLIETSRWELMDHFKALVYLATAGAVYILLRCITFNQCKFPQWRLLAQSMKVSRWPADCMLQQVSKSDESKFPVALFTYFYNDKSIWSIWKFGQVIGFSYES